MNFLDTYFSFLEPDCIIEFGEKAGAGIYAKTEGLFQSFLSGADYRNNESIKEHMQKNIVPVIAYYQSLQEYGYTKEEAYALTLKATQKMARGRKEQNQRLARLPFAYQIFKLFCKPVMKKSYPAEGWNTEWVRRDNTAIQVNLRSCLYVDITAKHGCPELCSVFCKNDTTSFAGYAPKILFQRHATIAEGGEYCDFHFMNGKR